MGNNLFSKRAIALVDFIGYAGRGTQDLFLSYKLAARGLNYCVIPHSVSNHVVRKQNADGGELTVYQLYHEHSGEFMGHLRQRETPFYTFEAGERTNPREEDYSI